jgi:hypothetical protein
MGRDVSENVRKYGPEKVKEVINNARTNYARTGLDPDAYTPPSDSDHDSSHNGVEPDERQPEAAQSHPAVNFKNDRVDLKGTPQPEPKPLRPMPSWIDLGELEVDRKQYHVGAGFVEIGGFIMLIGQSYADKSTLITQISINMAIGRTWLFFKVERELKVLIVQAEDTQNKLIKMGHMFKRMGLSTEQIETARKNTRVLTIRDLQDEAAIKEIERHSVADFKPDVVVINPMTSYLGGSVYKDEVINKFLRVQLTPLLDRLSMSAIVVHHPPKPPANQQDQKDLTEFELQYGGAGMAALTNAPRGNMFLTHVNGDTFKLSVGKGFDDLGTSETAAMLRRSKDQADVMLWERCDSEHAEEANQKQAERKSRTKPATKYTYDSLLKLFKPTAKIAHEKVLDITPKGRDWTRDALKQLVLEKKLIKSTAHNPKGAPHVFYHLPTILEPA